MRERIIATTQRGNDESREAIYHKDGVMFDMLLMFDLLQEGLIKYETDKDLCFVEFRVNSWIVLSVTITLSTNYTKHHET